MGVHFREKEEKLTLGMIIAGIVIIAILVTSFIVYLLNANNANTEGEILEEAQASQPQETPEDDLESVSIDIGKTVNEAANESNVVANNTVNSSTNSNTAKNTTNTSGGNTNASTNTSSNTTNTTTDSNTAAMNNTAENTEVEVKFTAPIQGEILREFASDSLVYSETLEEWVTHNGVDIKADKTSVVKAAAKGTVYAIKNDPRYGLTVIVNHEGGYQTVYANLLTAEYVVEGEEIDVGQTIGTVGNSATFEIADDYHLHFELIKDNEYLNPANYMEF